MDLSETITNLGNLVTAVPVTLLIITWIWKTGSPPVARMFGVSFLCALAAIVVLKLVSHSLGAAPGGEDLYALSTGAPSGHAGVATVVYGSAMLLFLIAGRGIMRFAGSLACLAAVIGVAITRVTLHTHTIADVIAALIVAGVFVIPFGIVVKREARHWHPPLALLLLCMIVLALLLEMTGIRFTSDEVL